MVRCHRCPIPVYESLNESAVYPVIMPSYIIHGGDGYYMIEKNLAKYYNFGMADFRIYYYAFSTLW